MILSTVALAFSRPAFEVPLDCETSTEFFQALSDTQRAVRTGELLDRESRHVIRKSIGGWRDIDDEATREDLCSVDKYLRKLRAEIEQGRKNNKIYEVNGFLNIADIALANHLEDLRAKCVRRLNTALQRWRLPEI